jgi:hypothetical protein
MVAERLTWFAGIDWGSERHQACLLDAQGNIVAEREFPHSGAGLAELGDRRCLIRTSFGRGKIHTVRRAPPVQFLSSAGARFLRHGPRISRGLVWRGYCRVSR